MAYRRRRMMRLASPVILVATLAVPTFAVAVVRTAARCSLDKSPTAYVSNYGDNSVTPIDSPPTRWVRRSPLGLVQPPSLSRLRPDGVRREFPAAIP